MLGDIHELLEIARGAGQEVSKIHEEFLRGPVSELIRALGSGDTRGELTLIIGGAAGQSRIDEDLLKAEVNKLKGRGFRVKEIAEILGEKFGYSKKEIYRLALLEEKVSP
jgi:16S rRNA (cytidine1402-2'-O)-methyltransferase